MFNNILIATDNSKAVHHAMRYAAFLFPKASFHVVSVVNTSNRSVPMTDIIREEMERAARGGVEEARKILVDAGVKCFEASVRTGTPSKEIRHYIDENKIDLLVITRTAKECTPYIGATCLHILEIVHCPVLIVPQGTVLKKPASVFNPTSGSIYSMSASEMAVLLADTFGAPLFSLYVGKNRGKHTLGAVESMAEKLGVVFKGRDAEHPFDRDLLECARKHDIMVFSRGYAGIRYKLSKLKKKMILGKLDREVISDSATPMLVVGD